jgi:hypothetical protein
LAELEDKYAALPEDNPDLTPIEAGLRDLDGLLSLMAAATDPPIQWREYLVVGAFGLALVATIAMLAGRHGVTWCNLSLIAFPVLLLTAVGSLLFPRFVIRLVFSVRLHAMFLALGVIPGLLAYYWVGLGGAAGELCLESGSLGYYCMPASPLVGQPSNVAVLFAVGALGGVVATYLRIREMPPEPLFPVDRATQALAVMQVYVSAFVAGVFGVIVYVFMFSGILKGDLFPKLTGVDVSGQNFLDFLYADDAQPLHRVDIAKALVWAFVAGFSERLVPNIIDTVVQKAKAAEK